MRVIGRWTAWRGGLPVLLGLQLLVLVPLSVSVAAGRLRFPAYRVDLDVYRLGSSALLHGAALYGTLPPTQDGQHLLFTYPPFAAIVLAPAALVPYWLACLAVTLATVVLLGLAVVTILRSLDALPGGRWRWARVGGLLVLAEVLEPVQRTVFAGQVDILVLALVALDVLAVSPRWPRGLLVGLAAAIKLTPAVFLLYFLLGRDRRAALVAGLTFVAATALGFLVAGADSVRYWTSAVFDSGRVGQPSYAGDQSLLGLLTRLRLPTTVLWPVLVAVVVVVTAIGVRRAFVAGHPALALGLNAVCGLLISPISWTHHWVWVVLLLPALLLLGRRTGRRAPVVLAAVGLVLFVSGPQWWWPRGGTPEYGWNFLQQLTGNGYVLFGLFVLAAATVYRFAPRPAAVLEPAPV